MYIYLYIFTSEINSKDIYFVICNLQRNESYCYLLPAGFSSLALKTVQYWKSGSLRGVAVLVNSSNVSCINPQGLYVPSILVESHDYNLQIAKHYIIALLSTRNIIRNFTWRIPILTFFNIFLKISIFTCIEPVFIATETKCSSSSLVSSKIHCFCMTPSMNT